VVGGVAVVLIIALTCYFIVRRRPQVSHGTTYVSPVVPPQSPDENKRHPEYEMQPPVEVTPIRYPDSGNVRGDY